MIKLEKELNKMDIQYFGTSSHIISPEAFFQKENIVLLDVRTKQEIENVKLTLTNFCKVLEIPVNEISYRNNEIPKDKFIGIFCSGGIRAAMIFTYLLGKGYRNIKILDGGYNPMMDALKPGKVLKKINK
ncbi:MAG: rhodanese-like domain-containing protein [Bacteroidales bacterium]